VVGAIETGSLGVGVQIAYVDDPSRRGGDCVPDLGHAHDRQHAGVEGSGREDDLVGLRDGLERARARGRVGRHQLDPPYRRAAGHRFDCDLADHGPTADIGHHRHGIDRRRDHPSDRTEEPPDLVERVGQIAERLREADEHEVAERMTGELARREAVLECGRPRAVAARQRDQALAQIAGRGDTEIAAEATR